MTIKFMDQPVDIRRRELRARRQAVRRDLKVIKSRKDGSFMLVDIWTNAVVAGGYGHYGCEYGMWLEDVERELLDEGSQ